MTKRKIIIPLEVSEISGEILPVVLQLFEPERTSLTLIAVVQPFTTMLSRDIHLMDMPSSKYTADVVEEEWKAYYQGIEDHLNHTARQLQEAGYSVAAVLRTGNTVHEIANFVEQNNFDLLAMATYGRKGLSRLIFGSVAEELLRLVSIPMLLMRHQPTTKAEATPETRLAHLLSQDQKLSLVVATDGTEHSLDAVALAGELVQALKADWQVLVAVKAEQGSAHAQQVMQATQEIVWGRTPRPKLIPLVGAQDENLGNYLDKSFADLLVISAFADRDAGAPNHVGHTVQRVIQFAPMSVIVVKQKLTRFKRILACVGVDDTAVVESAIQLAKAIGAELQILHVLAGVSNTRGVQLAQDDPALKTLLERNPHSFAFLHKTVDTLNEWGFDRSTLQLWRGEILKTILDITRRSQCDLLVVGNHSGAEVFPDTMSYALVSYAPKSVLIVRTRSKTGSTPAPATPSTAKVATN